MVHFLIAPGVRVEHLGGGRDSGVGGKLIDGSRLAPNRCTLRGACDTLAHAAPEHGTAAPKPPTWALRGTTVLARASFTACKLSSTQWTEVISRPQFCAANATCIWPNAVLVCTKTYVGSKRRLHSTNFAVPGQERLPCISNLRHRHLRSVKRASNDNKLTRTRHMGATPEPWAQHPQRCHPLHLHIKSNSNNNDE